MLMSFLDYNKMHTMWLFGLCTLIFFTAAHGRRGRGGGLKPPPPESDEVLWGDTDSVGIDPPWGDGPPPWARGGPGHGPKQHRHHHNPFLDLIEQTFPRCMPTKQLGQSCTGDLDCTGLAECAYGVCICGEGMIQKFVPGPQRSICVIAPGFGESCAEGKCQMSMTCNDDTDKCQCVAGFSRRGIMCVPECPPGEINIAFQCLKATKLGQPCRVTAECVSPYSTCKKPAPGSSVGKCSCVPGMEEKEERCIVDIKCFDGSAPIANDGEVQKCVRTPSIVSRFLKGALLDIGVPDPRHEEIEKLVPIGAQLVKELPSLLKKLPILMKKFGGEDDRFEDPAQFFIDLDLLGIKSDLLNEGFLAQSIKNGSGFTAMAEGIGYLEFLALLPPECRDSPLGDGPPPRGHGPDEEDEEDDDMFNEDFIQKVFESVLEQPDLLETFGQLSNLFGEDSSTENPFGGLSALFGEDSNTESPFGGENIPDFHAILNQIGGTARRRKRGIHGMRGPRGFHGRGPRNGHRMGHGPKHGKFSEEDYDFDIDPRIRLFQLYKLIKPHFLGPPKDLIKAIADLLPFLPDPYGLPIPTPLYTRFIAQNFGPQNDIFGQIFTKLMMSDDGPHHGKGGPPHDHHGPPCGHEGPHHGPPHDHDGPHHGSPQFRDGPPLFQPPFEGKLPPPPLKHSLHDTNPFNFLPNPHMVDEEKLAVDVLRAMEPPASEGCKGEDQYCAVAGGQQFGPGVCCKKPELNCPAGEPVEGVSCSIYDVITSETSFCPLITHYCHSVTVTTGHKAAVCCPRECPLTMPIHANGRCLPVGLPMDRCEVDEQCLTSFSHMTCRDVEGEKRCACAVGEEQIKGKCVPACRPGVLRHKGKCLEVPRCPAVVSMLTERNGEPTLCKTASTLGSLLQQETCPDNHFCYLYAHDSGVCCTNPSPKCPKAFFELDPEENQCDKDADCGDDLNQFCHTWLPMDPPKKICCRNPPPSCPPYTQPQVKPEGSWITDCLGGKPKRLPPHISLISEATGMGYATEACPGFGICHPYGEGPAPDSVCCILDSLAERTRPVFGGIVDHPPTFPGRPLPPTFPRHPPPPGPPEFPPAACGSFGHLERRCECCPEETCEDGPQVCCAMDCSSNIFLPGKCVCDEGYIKQKLSGDCVKKEDCKSIEQLCGENMQAESRCPCCPEPTCENPTPPCCFMDCRHLPYFCTCVDGFRKQEATGKCVPIDECKKNIIEDVLAELATEA